MLLQTNIKSYGSDENLKKRKKSGEPGKYQALMEVVEGRAVTRLKFNKERSISRWRNSRVRCRLWQSFRMSYHSSGDIRKLISAISHTKRKKCVCFGGGRGGGGRGDGEG